MSNETINTHEEQGESQEHIDAMAAKGEALEQANNPNTPVRPDWLPEKFKDVEQMAEAYGQLEKKLGSGEEGEGISTGDVEEGKNPEAETSDEAVAGSDVQQAVEAAGVDFDSLQTEYNEQGGLSEDAYGKLAEAGFPQDLVNSWIKGQEALANSYQSSIHDIVGGEKSYSDMTQWAGENLSETEISAFDRAVDSGDIDMVKLAVQGLQSKYQTAEGSDPSLLGGQSAPSSGGVYSSWAEVTQAMGDPRYNNDPAYRQSVSAKLGRSNVQ
jgi:hypothetical protein